MMEKTKFYSCNQYNKLESISKVRTYAIRRLREFEEGREINVDNSKVILSYLKFIGECARDDQDDRITKLEKIIKENPEKFKNKKIASGEFTVLSNDRT